jgi:Na+/serine symporter
VFAAVVSAIVSSSVFPAAFIAAAERNKASPMPPEEMAKLFNLLLSVANLLTM